MSIHSSLSLCGLPLAPVPWLSLWEMALEVKEDRETWERTRWTWENSGSDSCKKEESGRMTDQWVTDLIHLPYIVTDHTVRREDNMEEREEDTVEDRVKDKVWQADRTGDRVWQEDRIISSLVDDKHIRRIPIILESENLDDEMEDYYENHKAWPARSS